MFFRNLDGTEIFKKLFRFFDFEIDQYIRLILHYVLYHLYYVFYGHYRSYYFIMSILITQTAQFPLKFNLYVPHPRILNHVTWFNVQVSESR